ncbi:MAG: amidohydrolase [Myxococcales bacterium]|nr:MAG: amidohydrolase [Myxococcales bacterium]
MRSVRVLAVAAVLAIGALAWILLRPTPRTVYLGGPVLTVDATDRVVEALGVEGERIAAVGGREEVLAWGGSRARIVELAGRALAPGFIDAHGHFPGAGIPGIYEDLNSPPVGDLRSIDDIVARLAERAASTEEGEWVVGWSYDDTLLSDRRHPTRGDLDRASTRHPIVVWHISGHLCVANSAALERAGIDAAHTDPDGGRIRRDARGRPDGVLEETATELLGAWVPKLGIRQSLAILREATRRYLAAGVTTAQNGYAEADHLSGLLWASRLGLFPIRLVVWPGAEAAERILDGTLAFDPPAGSRVRRGAVKLIADGSIQAYTGYLGEPYHVLPGEDPGYRGYPRMARDELIRRVGHFHRAGWQVAVHGNGDAAIDDVLDAFEAAQREAPREDARHVLIHAQMARDDQLDRMQALAVIPSFFVLHTFYWGDRHREIFLGPERAARISPTPSAELRGLRFTLHADSPVVPMEPLRIVWAAVNRRTTSGRELGPAERISPQRALRAVTIDAARQHFQEGELGSLEPGKLADLVILSASPLEDPARIDEIRVLETIIWGRSEWRAASR